MTEHADSGMTSTYPDGAPLELRRERFARAVVWGTWVAMLAGAFALIVRFGSNVPFWDDWLLVPVLSGGKPLTAEWLWSEINTHRFPVAKFLLWTLARFTDGDLRSAMVASTAVLAAAAAVLIRCAATMRGRASVADAFFPILLLQWGQIHTLIWSINLHFACATALFLVVVCALQRCCVGGRALPWLLGAAALLPLHSAIGVVLTPPVMLWLAYAASRPGAARGRRIAIVSTLLVMTAIGLFAVTGLRHDSVVAIPSAHDLVRTTLQFLATSIGPAGQRLWPASGLAVAGLTAATVGLLVAGWRRRREERLLAAGLLACTLAMVGLAAAIGFSRAGLGWTAGIHPRYMVVSGPLLCCVFFAWQRFGGPRWGRLVPSALCVALLSTLWMNSRYAWEWASDQDDVHRALEADLHAGASPEELVERYWTSISGRRQGMVEALEIMRRESQGLYRR